LPGKPSANYVVARIALQTVDDSGQTASSSTLVHQNMRAKGGIQRTSTTGMSMEISFVSGCAGSFHKSNSGWQITSSTHQNRHCL
jgi:hypothetical protein